MLIFCRESEAPYPPHTPGGATLPAVAAGRADLTARTLLTRNAWDFDPLRVLMDVEFYADDPGR